jgi:hypothetical protein
VDFHKLARCLSGWNAAKKQCFLAFYLRVWNSLRNEENRASYERNWRKPVKIDENGLFEFCDSVEEQVSPPIHGRTGTLTTVGRINASTVTSRLLTIPQVGVAHTPSHGHYFFPFKLFPIRGNREVRKTQSRTTKNGLLRSNSGPVCKF